MNASLKRSEYVKTRYKGYSDYHLEPGEEKELKALCRKKDFKTITTLLLAAYKAYPELAYALAFSLHYSASYEKICNIYDITIPKVDFYGHRRKTLFYFKRYADIAK